MFWEWRQSPLRATWTVPPESSRMAEGLTRPQSILLGAFTSLVKARGASLDLDDPLASGGRVILAVGSDDRRHLSLGLRRVGGHVEGRRADAIGVVLIPPASAASVVRIPRDAVCDVVGVGHQRMGWALGYGGPACLIDTLREHLMIPVHHYVEFGFTSFARLVSAHGGLTASIAGDRTDSRAGLRRSRLGRLSGRQVLALARSRSPDDGALMSDLDRIQTQSRIVAMLLARRSSMRHAMSLLAVLPRLGRDLVIDNRWDQHELDVVTSGFARYTPSIWTVDVAPPEDGCSPCSPFTADVVSSSPVVEITEAGRRSLRVSVDRVLVEEG